MCFSLIDATLEVVVLRCSAKTFSGEISLKSQENTNEGVSS